MATPIKSLFPPIEKKNLFCQINKKREPSPDVVYRQNGDSAGDLGLSQLLVFAFHLLFLIAIYFLAFILFSLFILCNIYCDSFQFSILPRACMFIYLCLHILHGEPKKKKALDPSLSCLRLEKRDSGGKCDLCPLMLIWTFA